MNNIMQFYRSKYVLITGNTGFKGSWLSHVLLNLKANVSGYALPPDTNPNLFGVLKLKKRMTTTFGDIRNYQKVKEVIKKTNPEIIFHLAAQPIVSEGYKDPLYTFDTNIIGTANLLQAAYETKIPRAIVVVTTDKVYFQGIKKTAYKEGDRLGGGDPYSASKACCEILAQSYLMSFLKPNYDMGSHSTLIATARAGNVIGGGDWSRGRLMPDVVRSVFVKHNPIKIRMPNAIRPWQYVLDPLYGYLLLGKKLYDGDKDYCGPWNFGPSNENITVSDLVNRSLGLVDKIGYYAIEKEDMREEEILKLSSKKAYKMLSWKQRENINDTIKETIEWYKAYYSKRIDMLDFTNRQLEKYFSLYS
ncbi:MAG: CDP-glucose 4,6-dehydratase [Candidatus Micrarchaeaceae archaeon]